MKGFNINKLRMDLGMTQQEFAEFIGVDRRTVINYEQGKKIPASRMELLEHLVLSHFKEKNNEVSNNSSKKTEVIVEKNESTSSEVLELKDHIKTLRELINEKNKLAEIKDEEIKRLKDRITFLDNTLLE
jgi:transcriptional regulator with XRE-family HTH domain